MDKVGRGNFVRGAGNVVLWSQNNILHGVSGELRTNSAIPFLGEHRMPWVALVCMQTVILMPDKIARAKIFMSK